MNDLIGSFHFLRPVWLFAMIPAAIIWWRMYRGHDARQGLTDDIAPHLLDHLVSSPTDRPKFRPVTLLLPLWLLAIVALAGPSFRRIPSPFAADESQLVLVVRMTPSMLTTDLQPSRLERARMKLHDLLQQRPGASTSLIAYSGSAHLVMPATDDASVIDHMLEALDPAVMPSEGDALAEALAIASKQLSKSGKTGSVLVIADGVEATQVSALADWPLADKTPVQILAPLRDEATLSQSGLTEAAETVNANLHQITSDDSDIESIIRDADRAVVAAEQTDATQWRDDGYFLVPILACGLLFWCRRGWSLSAS